MISILGFIVGLYALSKAADYFVEGSSSLATKLNIPSLVIGLTIVAFGTSAPELAVSVLAALEGTNDIAFGNVIGSNIFNILFILGLSALISRLHIQKSTTWKEIPFAFLGVVATGALGLSSIINSSQYDLLTAPALTQVGTLGPAQGLILLSFFIIFLYYSVGLARKNSIHSQVEANVSELSNNKTALYIVAGLVGLILAGRIVVDQAIFIASSLGVSQKLIGLTIVSIGTSLPELITSIKATKKGEFDIAIGNVVGSNILNTFFILGITVLISPISIDTQNVVDLGMLFLATSLLFFFNFVFRRYSLGKIEGVIFLATYGLYVAYLLSR